MEGESMQTYVRKSATVQARECTAHKQNVISARKGHQVASAGDFLVQDDASLAVLRKREKDENAKEGSIPNKGTVYVVPRTEFLADYELETVEGSPREPIGEKFGKASEVIARLRTDLHNALARIAELEAPKAESSPADPTPAQ